METVAEQTRVCSMAGCTAAVKGPQRYCRARRRVYMRRWRRQRAGRTVVLEVDHAYDGQAMVCLVAMDGRGPRLLGTERLCGTIDAAAIAAAGKRLAGRLRNHEIHEIHESRGE